MKFLVAVLIIINERLDIFVTVIMYSRSTVITRGHRRSLLPRRKSVGHQTKYNIYVHTVEIVRPIDHITRATLRFCNMLTPKLGFRYYIFLLF